MRNVWTTSWVTALTIVTLSGCAGEGGGTGGGQVAAADTSEFQIAWNAQPPTMDPMVTTATATRDIARNILEPLVAIDNSGAVQGVLASDYAIENDGRSIVFTLRDDVVFHDGTPMEAEDVVASLQRWIEVSGSGKQFFTGADVAAEGADTVIVTTPEPMLTAIHLLADPKELAAVMPREIIESASTAGVEEIVGTGPYEFVSWETDQYIHLQRFEDYASPDGEASGLAGAREAVYEAMYYNFVPDASTRRAGLQTGEYDAANALPFDSYQQLQDDPNIEVSVGTIGMNGLVFNKRSGPMADPAMRHAVNAALDPEAIMHGAFTNPEFYSLNGALMLEGQDPWYTEAGLENYNVYNPQLAKDLLNEAGYDNEPIRILTTRDYEDHYNTAIIVEAQLKEAGINAELIVSDWATVLENRDDDTAYEAFTTGFTAVALPTKHPFLDPGWGGWTDDPAIAEAMDAITYAADEAAAADANDDLQRAFYEYLPIINFGDKTTLTAFRADLDGYEFPPGMGDIFFRMQPRE